MDQDPTKSVRVPQFSGAHKDFQVWWARWMAFASLYRFVQACKPEIEKDMPKSEDEELDETTDEGKKAAAAKKRNAAAMANFTMAFTSEGTMGMVFNSMSMAWPGGLAWKVVRALFAKYAPQDTISRVELRKMLNNVSMKPKDDPSTLFEQLSAIENRFNTEADQIKDEELIAVVIDAAPKEYKSILTSEQRAQGTAITVEKLEAAMTQHWRSINNVNANGVTEIELAAFNGTCFLCKQPGHKKIDCPQNKGQQQGSGSGGGTRRRPRFNGTCYNCGKQGHRSRDCWEKEENASKRPKNWKSSKEQAAPAVFQCSCNRFLDYNC